ncbi:aldehyde dehydrogenase family protein [Candidatus Laterigemmans baculatus]|uniref:aldehyde dehydrogenase family protein n=1 Tax=Candidatus Laterigemmans baculatus TaxID=2770505 RepID=UPI0013DA1A10|nr:aldehyde dehydrogenase family protein [Candidatus Laterigemmans baculatus]
MAPVNPQLDSAAQRTWASRSTSERCRIVSAAAERIVAAVEELIAMVASPQHSDPTETLAAELIPLCDALRFIGRRGPRVLATRRVGGRGRPSWLFGVTGYVERVPRGVVLVIGAWNYPLLLAGVQVAQALAAGNAVLWKPAPRCEASSERLAACFWAAGVPPECLRVLGSEASEASDAIAAGVDFVVLTGSAATGRRVLAQTAEQLTPSTLELSGCDAMLVLEGADLQRVAAALRFGLGLRGGATCIGPRRVLAEKSMLAPLVEHLHGEFRPAETGEEFEVHPAAREGVLAAVEDALQLGGVDLLNHWDRDRFTATGKMRPLVIGEATEAMRLMHSDVFGPVAAMQAVGDAAQAIDVVNRCRYGLAASVFGPHEAALRVARQLEVGCVTLNDLIAPTADPRLPFGGRRESGFGVTRGAEGLLEMTVPRVLSVRRRGPLLHLQRSTPANFQFLLGAFQMQYSRRWGAKWSGLRRLTEGVRLAQSARSTRGAGISQSDRTSRSAKPSRGEPSPRTAPAPRPENPRS